MARRRSSVAVLLLLLAAAAVLSNVPSAALASSSPSETTASSGGRGEQQASPASRSEEADDGDDDDDDDENKEQEMDPEKQKERQMAKEKAVAEEKAVQQELLKFAKEHGLVSPTNGTGSYKGIARDFLDAHNALRARYGVPAMKWDNKLARRARRWSNAMRKDCQMKHSVKEGDEIGESLFVSHDDWNATVKDAIAWWQKEEPIYDRETEKCSDGRNFKTCGHFALIVGKRSTRVGCARAECFKGGVFISCNYYPTDLKGKNKKSTKSH